MQTDGGIDELSIIFPDTLFWQIRALVWQLCVIVTLCPEERLSSISAGRNRQQRDEALLASHAREIDIAGGIPGKATE